MKYIAILAILMSCTAWGATIDLRDWMPEYKYKSAETYTMEEADNYCKNKKDCVPMYEKHSIKVRIYTTVTNCEPIIVGKNDTYVSTGRYQIDELINRCGDREKYEPVMIENHSKPSGYWSVWKIQKKTKKNKTPVKNIKFIPVE